MKMVTAPEAAKALGMSGTTIKRHAREGAYPYLMIGAHMLVDYEVVQPYEEQAKKEKNGIGIIELSKAINLKPSAIRRGIKEGWIPYHLKDNRHYRFVLEDVQKAIQEKMQAGNGDIQVNKA